MDTYYQPRSALQSFIQARMVPKIETPLTSSPEKVKILPTVSGRMAPFLRLGNSPPLYTLRLCLRTQTAPLFPIVEVGGGRRDVLPLSSLQYHVAYKTLALPSTPLNSASASEGGIHSFVKHLLGPTTRYRVLGLAPHHGKGGALAPWSRCSGSGCRASSRSAWVFEGPSGAKCLTFGWCAPEDGRAAWAFLLAPKGAATTCPEGNRYRASSARRRGVRAKIRRQLRLHSAPPLPLFNSDAAVEAAAAAASPAARGAPTRSRGPDFLFPLIVIRARQSHPGRGG